MSQYSAYINRVSDLKGELQRSLDFIQWKEVIHKDSKVFIKPNFTYPYYKKGITTTPELLQALLQIIKDRCDRVLIGESDGGNRSFTAADAFSGHNMHQICKDTGAELINLSKMPAENVEGVIQGKKVKVELPELLVNGIDCFVSVPVLKVHVMTGISLSIKNLWGCYPDTMRGLHHKHLDHKLALITKVVKPKICIIDGIYALDGHGPMFGTPREMNLLLASNNPVVADSLGTSIMGFSPLDIGHIVMSENEGIGITDLNKVILNTNWKQFVERFILHKTLIDRLSVLNFKSELLPKIIFDSPLTPLVYKLTHHIRTEEEKDMAYDLRRYSK